MLLDWDRRDYVITCGLDSSKEGEENLKALGLITEHAYGIIQVKRLQDEGISSEGDITLCQIRNPWGCGEWNGAWSDKSDKWTPEIKEKLGWTDEDDGKFWMDLEDVKRLFVNIGVNHYVNDYKFSNLKAEGSEVIMKVIVTTPGEYTFSISQKSDRMFDEDSGYEYSNCRLLVLNSSNNPIKGKSDIKSRDCFVQCQNLEAGTYHIFCEIDWLPVTEEKTFAVTSYGKDTVDF